MALHWLAVINPVSGGGRTLKGWQRIKYNLEILNISFDEVFTEYSGHAIKLVKQEAPKYHGILVVGGDGTTNEVINGILTSTSPETILGIIPSGTGNDIANGFGLPYDDINKACQLIRNGTTKKVDVGITKGRNFTGNIVYRYFGSFGFDADVSFEANKTGKRLSGTANYIVTIFKTLVILKSRLFKISLIENGSVTNTVEEKAFLFAVGNGAWYGAGMKICPEASVFDATFNATMVKEVSKLNFIKVLPTVFEGKHISHPEVRTFKASEFLVQNGAKTMYQVDGEVIGCTPTSVRTLPLVLNIMS